MQSDRYKFLPMDQQHSMTPENFLSNSKNKQAFIDFLCGKIHTSAPSGRLTNVQCTVDADRNTVATALDLLQQS